MNRHFTDSTILELRQDYGEPCIECQDGMRCFGCAYALATADELEANLAELEQAQRDLSLLRPVCSASSGGMVSGEVCPRCKGQGILRTKDGG